MATLVQREVAVMCPSPVAGQAEGLREADTGAHQQTERSREGKEQLRAQMRGNGEGMGDPPLIPMQPTWV